jgi:hypothetical protein
MRPFIMVLSRALADGREHRSAIGPNALGAVRGSCRGAAGKLKGERHCTERQDPAEGKDVHVGKDLCLPERPGRAAGRGSAQSGTPDDRPRIAAARPHTLDRAHSCEEPGAHPRLCLLDHQCGRSRETD